MKQQNMASVSTATSWAWQLEEAQVFWVKKEQGLALGLLKQMIEKLEDLVRVESNSRVWFCSALSFV